MCNTASRGLAQLKLCIGVPQGSTDQSAYAFAKMQRHQPNHPPMHQCEQPASTQHRRNEGSMQLQTSSIAGYLLEFTHICTKHVYDAVTWGVQEQLCRALCSVVVLGGAVAVVVMVVVVDRVPSIGQALLLISQGSWNPTPRLRFRRLNALTGLLVDLCA